MNQPARLVIRCGDCQLNQFMTVSGNCRKCSHSMIEREPIRIWPVLVEPPEPQAIGFADALALTYKLLRYHRGLSQNELAAKLGCRRQHIYKIENGVHTPSIETLLRHLKALEMTPYAFLSIVEKIVNSTKEVNTTHLQAVV